MLDKLYSIEKILGTYLRNKNITFHSMYIDYEPPIVERIWFQLGDDRVYLHKIHKAKNFQTLYHPHPWKSAIRIVEGSYEMGVGHSATDETPPTDCLLVLKQGSAYTMFEQDAWHWVNPITDFVYSLMITGERFNRKMPVEPEKKFNELTSEQFKDIIAVFQNYYPENDYESEN